MAAGSAVETVRRRGAVSGHVLGHGRDILRLEYFGALYYERSTGRVEAIPSEIAELLVASNDRHIMEVWRDSSRSVDLGRLIVEAAQLADLGVLDDDYRLRARVVNGAQRNCLSAPIVTNLQLTRACNLSCEHCFVDVAAHRDPRELSLEQLTSLFRELGDAGAPLVIFAGGEPMLRPDFWEIIAEAGRADLDVALCTNATRIRAREARRLSDSLIRWYSVSLDGPSAALHDAQRGRGMFARTISGVRALVAAGARGLKLRVTVTAMNATALADFAGLARDLGVSEVVFKPFRRAPTGNAHRNAAHLYITRADYLRAVEDARERWPEAGPNVHFDDGLPESLPAWTRVTPEFGCVGGTTHASVVYDGRVVACDAIFDPRDWTLHEHTFLDAWRHAPSIRAWRHLEAGEDCDACSSLGRCGGGCRARAVAAGGTLGDPDPWSYCERPRHHPALAIIS